MEFYKPEDFENVEGGDIFLEIYNINSQHGLKKFCTKYKIDYGNLQKATEGYIELMGRTEGIAEYLSQAGDMPSEYYKEGYEILLEDAIKEVSALWYNEARSLLHMFFGTKHPDTFMQLRKKMVLRDYSGEGFTKDEIDTQATIVAYMSLGEAYATCKCVDLERYAIM